MVTLPIGFLFTDFFSQCLFFLGTVHLTDLSIVSTVFMIIFCVFVLKSLVCSFHGDKRFLSRFDILSLQKVLKSLD